MRDHTLSPARTRIEVGLFVLSLAAMWATVLGSYAAWAGLIR